MSQSQARRQNATVHGRDKIEHIAIEVRDIAESVNWYISTFRCEVEYQDSTFARLLFENITLSFVISEQHPAHIAVLRDDAAAFGKLTTHRDGTRSVSYLYDPFGNPIEVQLSTQTIRS
jgi:YD repeat-containing protein